MGLGTPSQCLSWASSFASVPLSPGVPPAPQEAQQRSHTTQPVPSGGWGAGRLLILSFPSSTPPPSYLPADCTVKVKVTCVLLAERALFNTRGGDNGAAGASVTLSSAVICPGPRFSEGGGAAGRGGRSKAVAGAGRCPDVQRLKVSRRGKACAPRRYRRRALPPAFEGNNASVE